jgi:hypothetical protein
VSFVAPPGPFPEQAHPLPRSSSVPVGSERVCAGKPRSKLWRTIEQHPASSHSQPTYHYWTAVLPPSSSLTHSPNCQQQPSSSCVLHSSVSSQASVWHFVPDLPFLDSVHTCVAAAIQTSLLASGCVSTIDKGVGEEFMFAA